MSCQLRFSAADFDIDAFLQGSDLQPHTVFREGTYSQTILSSSISEHPGFNVHASEAEFDDLQNQIEDTTKFIILYRKDLKALSKVENKIYYVFDFGVETTLFDEDVWRDTITFPVEILLLLAEVGAGLEVSYYHPASDEEDENDEQGED